MAEDSYENLDIGYFEMPLPNTAEFTVVRFLNKTGLARFWSRIKDKFVKIPSGGSTGQALVKTETGIEWGDVAADLPDVLPVEKGGTGCTTIDGIRTMLFNFPTEEEVEEYLNQGE